MGKATKENPVGLVGFDFIEFSGEDPQGLRDLFRKLGFSKLLQHGSQEIDYFRQHDIHFLINTQKGSQAMAFAKTHGPCASATGWRVRDAKVAFEVALSRGAKAAPVSDYKDRHGRLIPAILGVGDSLIYFIDDWQESARWEHMGFKPHPQAEQVPDLGFALVDHLTNNVYKGQLGPLADFYKRVFGFEEVRYFDIDGKQTGLVSYALRSPCGSFCIPINEAKDAKSQIQEYLEQYHGEGIQHIAFLTSNILNSMRKMQSAKIEMLDIDADYYDDLFERFPHVSEDPKAIREFNLLVDGNQEGYLLQIFTKNMIGPIFFEFIQRRNYMGFGEGNFGALFRAIEKDQERRGVL